MLALEPRHEVGVAFVPAVVGDIGLLAPDLVDKIGLIEQRFSKDQ